MNKRDFSGQKTKSERELIAENISKRIIVKQGGLHLVGDNGGQLEVLAQGERGMPGKDGKTPQHQIDGHKIRFENPDGTWGQWINFATVLPQDGYTPIKGKDYSDGKDGYTPVKGKDYFDGKDGYTPIKGKDYFDGKNIKGDKGDTPKHQIVGYKIRFENSDGTWGQWIDLTPAKGEPGKDGKSIKGEQGKKGDVPFHQWDGTKIRFENPDGTWGQWVDLLGPRGIDGKNGKDGKSVQGPPGSSGERGRPGIAPAELHNLVNSVLTLQSQVAELQSKIELLGK